MTLDLTGHAPRDYFRPSVNSIDDSTLVQRGEQVGRSNCRYPTLAQLRPWLATRFRYQVLLAGGPYARHHRLTIRLHKGRSGLGNLHNLGSPGAGAARPALGRRRGA